ncbi:MAG: cyanophycin synthetase, partial [Clostridia bacterium]
IDGAHNSAGMTALYDSIKNLMPNKRISVIFGCLRDKGYADMTKIAAQLADDLILISPNSPRAANVCELVPFAKNAITAASPADAIKIARATNPDAILVCGSLYLAGEMSGVNTINETERTTL